MLGNLITELCSEPAVVYRKSTGVHSLLIFKNGSTSLNKAVWENNPDNDYSYETNWGNISTLTVYLRDPFSRVKSGIATYLATLDNTLDIPTSLYFIQKYPFLNKHYCPQYYWLISASNMNRQMSFDIKHMSDLKSEFSNRKPDIQLCIDSMNDQYTDRINAVATSLMAQHEFDIDRKLISYIGRKISCEEFAAIAAKG